MASPRSTLTKEQLARSEANKKRAKEKLAARKQVSENSSPARSSSPSDSQATKLPSIESSGASTTKTVQQSSPAQINCVCPSAEEKGHMIQCEICSSWLHSVCIGVSPSIASRYPFACPFCKETSSKNSRISDIEYLHFKTK